jgi:hypothetical protein
VQAAWIGLGQHKEKIVNLDDVFKQDQNDEPIKQLTRMLGIYYNGLIDNGIPPDTASQMIQDYHWTSFCCAIYKDTGNFPPRS